MDRRSFIITSLLLMARAVVAGGGATVLGCNVDSASRTLPAPLVDWLGSFEHGAAASERFNLGKGDTEMILASVSSWLGGLDLDDSNEFEASVRDRIDQDFERGRVVRTARGWVLARTEAAVFLLQAELRDGGVSAS